MTLGQFKTIVASLPDETEMFTEYFDPDGQPARSTVVTVEVTIPHPNSTRPTPRVTLS